MEKEKLLVSACFVSDGFKYNGGSNYNIDILRLEEKYEFVLICLEVFGGLSVPRLPSEISGDKVISSSGADVTYEFNKGALKALEIAKINNCKKALLKAKSPSCGKNQIYDGTFTHTIREGNGITVSLLEENGIEVFTEEELYKL